MQADQGSGGNGQGWRQGRMRRFLMVRVGLWLAMVAFVIALNLIIGGRFWGVGFIFISGGLMLFRLTSMWFMSRRRRRDGGQARLRDRRTSTEHTNQIER
jgi:hypothetical protein